MAEEPQVFDVEGALARLEDVEPVILPGSIPFVESDELEVLDDNNPNPRLQQQDIIPEVEDEAHEAEAPPGLLVAHDRGLQEALDDAPAQVARELRAFQARDIHSFGRHPPRIENPEAEDMNYLSDSDQTDSEDDQESSVPADMTNMNRADSLEPPADINMDQNSESAGTNVTTDQDSEPGDTDMDLDSDQSTELQEPEIHDRLVAAKAQISVVTSNRRLDVSHELKDEAGAVQSPTQPPIEESFTKELAQLTGPSDQLSRFVAPSPLPSSQIVPSASSLTICKSSLEPNLTTTMSSVGDCGKPGAIFNMPAD